MTYRAALFCLIALMFLPLPGDASSQIYRTTDAKGNVIFTDVPPADSRTAEESVIELPPVNTFPPEGGAEGRSDGRVPWIVEDGELPEAGFVPYTALEILAPAHDSSFRDNSGNVSITVGIEPGLSAEHSLRLLMDGKPVALNASTSFQLENVDRGTHTLMVEVVTPEGQSLQQSAPVSFHLLRYHLPVAKPTKTK